jgi:hypothetical protein
MTEKEVNTAALGALRSHYRFRVKKDSPELSSDVRGAGGIVADGIYAFQKDDGGRFLATVEATSLDKREEVYYRVHRWLLFWDSMATSSLLAAFLFTLNFIQGRFLVLELGIGLTSLLLLVAFVGGTLLSMLVLGYLLRLRRYRYIYAIEQFKRYHADEQWVAISEMVFPDLNNKKFLELRDQCIYNGFGLILVRKNRKPYLIITPARREVFEQSRQVVQFFSQKQINRLLKRTANVQEWWKKWGKGLPLQLNLADPRQFFRFRRPVYNQLIVIGIAWVVIAAVFYREWQQRPIRYVSQDRYAAEVNKRQSEGDPEPNRPILLAEDSLHVRPFNDQVVPYLLVLQAERVSPATASVATGGNDILIGMFEDALIVYDCERLYNFTTRKFMLQEAVYPDFESASRRMSELLAAGVQANVLWLGCFSDSDERYVVYFDFLMNDQREAAETAALYAEQLRQRGMNAQITIRRLIPR